MKKILFKLLIATLFCSLAQAHGEDKPGPNGGYIRMPGNFHTEVVPDKEGSFHVYLLDIQFKNPSVNEAGVKATIVQGKNKTSIKCKIIADHFYCKNTKAIKTGELILLPKREGTVGIEAKYKLPLKFATK